MSVKERIEVVKCDITTLKVDAIVNAANKMLNGGGGVDGAIHKAAGESLKEECERLNGCNVGEAKITPGFRLPATFVIHTVGPIWQGGKKNEESYLASAYFNTMEIASNNFINTIAFPCISTGMFGFPFAKASKIAIKVVSDYLSKNVLPQKVIFVCYSQDNFETYKKLLSK